MAMAITLQSFLDHCGAEYEVLPHAYTSTSMSAARSVNVPGDKFIKPVILEDANGYLMAVIPSTHHVELGRLSRQLNRRLGLATEQELTRLFADCELGAIPPIGKPYGIDMIIEDSLLGGTDIYFEAGDHVDAVHMSGDDFYKLIPDVAHGKISKHN